MKRIYFLVLATFLFAAAGFAQKGNHAIGAGADLSFPTGEFGDYYKTGFGVYAKGMLGTGKAGQVTITSGYSAFKERGVFNDFITTVSVIPLFLGYRHYFNSVFIEPQLGYALYGSKYTTIDEGTYTESDGALNVAATIGYVFNKQVEVSARYQAGGKEGWTANMFGLRLGYNFLLKQAK